MKRSSWITVLLGLEVLRLKENVLFLAEAGVEDVNRFVGAGHEEHLDQLRVLNCEISWRS